MRIQLNDTEFYAYTAGHAPRGDRDTVVFVHGAAMEHSVWSHQSRYFAYHGDNIAAVDLPGHNWFLLSDDGRAGVVGRRAR